MPKTAFGVKNDFTSGSVTFDGFCLEGFRFFDLAMLKNACFTEMSNTKM